MHVKKQLELRTMALSLVLLLSLKMVQLTQNKSQLFKGLNVEHRKTFPFVNFNYLSSHYNLIRTAKLYSKEIQVGEHDFFTVEHKPSTKEKQIYEKFWLFTFLCQASQEREDG